MASCSVYEYPVASGSLGCIIVTIEYCFWAATVSVSELLLTLTSTPGGPRLLTWKMLVWSGGGTAEGEKNR